MGISHTLRLLPGTTRPLNLVSNKGLLRSPRELILPWLGVSGGLMVSPIPLWPLAAPPRLPRRQMGLRPSLKTTANKIQAF